MDEFEAGKELIEVTDASYKAGNYLFAELEGAVADAVTTAEKSSQAVYNDIFSRLVVNPDTKQIEQSTDNLALIQPLMGQLKTVQTQFRAAYGRAMVGSRTKIINEEKKKEKEIGEILKEVGIKTKRGNLSDESYGLIKAINERGYAKINSIIHKWEQFIYDTFYSGILGNLDLVGFRGSFFDEDDHLKIGSTLRGEALQTALISVVEQRTSFVRQQAREEGMTYVWNFNPMDRLTKPICAMATTAGCISAREMASDYGFPPRYICRCDISFTRKEWVNVNRGINAGIEERRVKWIRELENSPKQRGEWMREGHLVRSHDPERIAGTLMYASVVAQIEAGSVPVPAYALRPEDEDLQDAF